MLGGPWLSPFYFLIALVSCLILGGLDSLRGSPHYAEKLPWIRSGRSRNSKSQETGIPLVFSKSMSIGRFWKNEEMKGGEPAPAPPRAVHLLTTAPRPRLPWVSRPGSPPAGKDRALALCPPSPPPSPYSRSCDNPHVALCPLEFILRSWLVYLFYLEISPCFVGRKIRMGDYEILFHLAVHSQQTKRNDW